MKMVFWLFRTRQNGSTSCMLSSRNNLGLVKRFLGLVVSNNRRTYLSFSIYRFSQNPPPLWYVELKPRQISVPNTASLHKRLDDEEPTDEKLYREILLSNNDLSTYTRPDLAQYLSNHLLQYMP